MRIRTAAVVLTAVCASVASGGPQVLTYQGSLVGLGGRPVADGTYSMRFSIYDDPAAGTQRWTETHSVEVRRGLYSVVLGETSAFGNLFNFYYGLWMQIEVDLDGDGFEPSETYAPRQRLASAAWAVDADKLQGHSSDWFQRRVTGSAPPGQFIRAINADGTVTTAADQTVGIPIPLVLDVTTGSTAIQMANPGTIRNVLAVSMNDNTAIGPSIINVDDIKFSPHHNPSIDLQDGLIFNAGELRFTAAGGGLADLNQGSIEDVDSLTADSVTAGEYDFNPAPTFYRVYGFMDMLSTTEGDTRLRRVFDFPLPTFPAGYLYIGGAATTSQYMKLAAGVHLPQGATVTQLQAVVYDNDAPGNIVVELRRYSAVGYWVTMAATGSTDVFHSTDVQTYLNGNIFYPTIDNQNFTYIVIVTIEASEAGSDLIRFYRSRIGFTMSRVAQ